MFVVGFIAWAVSRAEQNNPALEMHTVQTPKEAAKPNFTLEKFSWRKDGFDSVMVADFTFNNKNAFDIKDVEVRCEHSAESGTMIDANDRTIYQLFRGYSARTVTGFNMGFIHSQARRTSCNIVNFAIVPGTERPKPTAAKKLN